MSMTVYCHETRDICEGLPELLHRFPVRALLAARREDRVVVAARHGEPRELRLLNSLGFGPDPDHVIYTDDKGRVLAGHMPVAKTPVAPFSGTTSLGRLFAARNGLPFRAPARSACIEANSKGLFQEIANLLRESGAVKSPDGEAAHGEEREAVIGKLLTRYGQVIVKGTQSSSGLQQKIIRSGESIDLLGLPETVVVQEWVEGKSSPSVNLEIGANGEVKYLFETEQILEGTHHVGNRLVTGTRHRNSSLIRRAAVTIGREYWRRGYYGPCGIDFLDDYAIEVNARVTAPWYPWQGSQNLCGRPLPFCMRSARIRPDATVDDLMGVLGGRLFDRATLSGAVPFCFLPEYSFLYVVTYSEDEARLSTLYEEVSRALSELR